MDQQLGRGIANGAMAGAMWGLVFLAPVLLHDFSPLLIASGRYLAYGLLATLLLTPSWAVLRPRLQRRDWLTLGWLSLSGHLLYFILVAMAVQMAGGAATSLIVGMVPLALALLSRRSVSALPWRRLWPALVLSLSGVALIALQALRREHGGGSPWYRLLGLGCALAALLSWTAYALGNRQWLRRRPEISAHQGSLLIGLVTGLEALLLAAAAAGGLAPSHASSRWLALAAVSTLTALLASVIGNACWNRVSHYLPLELAGQMVVFETLFALLYTFIWQQRGPTAIEALAVLCLLGGVWLAARAAAPRAARGGARR